MNRLALARLLLIINGMVSLFMLPSLVMAVILWETLMLRAFVIPLAIGLVPALPAAISLRKVPLSIRLWDRFLLVFLTWVIASILGSLPYYFSPVEMSVSDAIFESACGFATTGATTFSNIEALPRSLLFWRSMSQWAGGMGIILLTVALMPILGVGGFQLFKTETTGPEKEKFTPRITEAAKLLWGVYCVFTLVLSILYRLGGMDWFDAICHGLTVMATGGMSTKNNGFAYYNSPFIDWVTVIFMLLGALNFNLYYRIVRGKFRDFVYNTEAKIYFLIFIIAAAVVSLSLVPQYASVSDALRLGSFQVASILTTTGTIRSDYTAWPGLAQGVLFCLMFVGGCSGSTAGGIKVIRHTVLFKQAGNEFRRMLYPQGVFSIHLNRKVGRKDVVYGVAAFVFLYLTVVAVTTLLTAASGLDLFSSLNTALSITGNIGAGFGIDGPYNNFSAFPDYLKLYYSFVMIAGRLELWTVLILFTPEYWKR